MDIAEIIEDMDDENMLLVFRMLPKELSARVFTEMEPFDQLRIVNSINEMELHNIYEKMDFDDKIDLLEEMPANVVTKVVAKVDPSERKLINEFLKYPEDSAGSIMTIEYVRLKPDVTVGEALQSIKESVMDKETIYTCYVENKYKKLLGFVTLKTLIISDKESHIEDVMNKKIVSVVTTEDREEVVDKFMRYGYIALPVVDHEYRLCGIITFDDVFNVAKEEATEDFHKMAAINPSEREYLDQSAWQLAKNRIPWLLVLMISATFTSGIIDNYNYIIAQYLILTTFIPMITDTGGNSGSQSSTIIIRALATGEIVLSDSIKVILKELEVGLICGSILAVTNFARLEIFTDTPMNISALVSMTVFFTVILAKIMGALLPLGAKKLNMDPAIMASAVITTIVDSVVLVIFFGLAKIILPVF
ncbi:magnesium transporter [Peptoniphilus sp. ING2-D1G]|nr:magnesium transporter [Peptoniphilus sp. ING2-D1G]